MMTMTPLAGLSAVADGYDALLCDVWGVLHNGVRAYPAAGDALVRFRARGTVVLVTNSPRLSPGVASQLDGLGVPRAAYDAIVSSGDVVQRYLVASGFRRVYHIGPARDLPIYEGTQMEVVARAAEADVIVCVGPREDEVETAETYRNELAALVPLGIPFVCANPDTVVERGDRLITCAGALAAVFEELGGTALQFGKPHAPIYEAAWAHVPPGATREPQLLVVGDGLGTDIAGAYRQHLDALFITDGIHALDVGAPGAPDPAKVADRLSEAGLQARYFAPRLAW